jgi:hypothetical protein
MFHFGLPIPLLPGFTVYAIEQDDRQPFIIMELLEGRSLAQMLGRHTVEILYPESAAIG